MSRADVEKDKVAKPKVLCREIFDDDLEAIADLEARGFNARTRAYWLRGLRRAQARAIPPGYPRYGYMLESEGRPVGAVLVLYSEAMAQGHAFICCNVGAWYVEPGFRGHAPRLLWAALRHKHVTYTDVTPAVSTYPIVERLGFRRYCNGLYFSLPVLSRTATRMRLRVVAPQAANIAGLNPAESDLLLSHARYDCLSITCETPAREIHPFIFLPFRMWQGRIPLPAMKLVYCRDIDSYRRCAGAIGRELLRRGRPIVILDANSALDGLIGIYTERRGRKYFRGPCAPSLTDLTNTELVFFGP